MKKKEKKYVNLKKSFVYYKKHIPMLILIALLGFVISGLNMLGTVFEGQALGGFTDLNYKTIIYNAIYTLVIAVSVHLIVLLWHHFLIKLNQKIKVDIKYDIINKLVDLKTKNFDVVNSGVFISRVNKDANELSTFYNSIIDCITEVISSFAFLIYLAFLNVWITLFVVLEIVITFILENWRLKVLIRNTKNWKEADEKVVGGYSEVIRGVRDVKALNLKKALISKVTTNQNEAIFLSKKREFDNNVFRRIRGIITSVFVLIFLLLCLYFINLGVLSSATFFMVYLYSDRIRGLVVYMVNIKESVANGELAAERVFEILDGKVYDIEKFGTKELDNITGNVEFKGVEFSYSDEEKLFKDLNLKIEPNQAVAIVGKSGQGKSTILNLIDKLYDIKSGSITIDGVDIKELSENSLRNNVSIVMQTPYIFNTTIMENLKFVNENATEKDVIDACKKTQIHSFIQKLPNKYDSMIGENGVVLSGGQRQRLAIARALLKNSKIILFDEATSALDNDSQSKIKAVIDNLKIDHTIVIVAHRLSTVVDCDNIFVLDENKIVASGKHKELMKNCDVYKELYKMEEN